MSENSSTPDGQAAGVSRRKLLGAAALGAAALGGIVGGAGQASAQTSGSRVRVTEQRERAVVVGSGFGSGFGGGVSALRLVMPRGLSSPKRSASAAPIPRAPPVTTITFSAKFTFGSWRCGGGFGKQIR
ncbi:hypothetical protein [Actinophytocola oryzae]|uniref:Uncharacterized protein n=1 Tax=Actinophytocola oryzae TaxID=502181 RepID=A0A4R7W0K9_9PSEU|nr:hypothetical protein [Actinophytocola oryzae]TDV55964.1 hypothetical protein CLV71_10225 [Actinophytocola oryzae]